MAAVERQDRYVFSSRWRAIAFAHLAITVPIAAGLGAFADGRREYLTAWAAITLLYAPPALLAAPAALRHVAPRDRTPWRLWVIGWCVVYGSNLVVYLVGARGWEDLRAIVPVAAVLGTATFGVGNTLVLRRRSGQRTLLLDLVDLLLMVLAITGPVALLVAEPIVTSQHAWLTVPAALVTVGLVHALVALAFVYARLPRDRRRGLVLLVSGFCLVALLDAVAQIAQGVTDFALPGGPLVAVHALCMDGGVFLAVFALRLTAPGLDRLPPQQQVRKNGGLAVVVLASVAIMTIETVWRRQQAWVVVTALVLLIGLLVLSTVRQLCLGRETVRLYGEVERAADERRELLDEVMRYVDSDRHRAAAQLHKQAAALYAAMASFTGADVAAQRVRFDLGRQVDASHQILAAMRPHAADQQGLQRLVALTRAYVGNLYGDVRRPALDVSVDERLALDWTQEVVVFRIVQMAVHNIWRHTEATRIRVSVTAPEGALTVEVRDDGAGFDPDQVVLGTGIVTMRALASFVDGRVEIDTSPGVGTRVCAVVGDEPPQPPADRPVLRLVRSVEQPQEHT